MVHFQSEHETVFQVPPVELFLYSQENLSEKTGFCCITVLTVVSVMPQWDLEGLDGLV